jgi:hypothetical protein
MKLYYLRVQGQGQEITVLNINLTIMSVNGEKLAFTTSMIFLKTIVSISIFIYIVAK